jgi:hypothetical protein
VKILLLFWPIPALLASAACVVAIRWIFRRPSDLKEPRAWFLTAVVVVGMLLTWRFSLAASPIGGRERIERHTGLDLPFWPRDSYYYDDTEGMIVASLRLTPAELAKVPHGTQVPRGEAESLLRGARAVDPELYAIPQDAKLDSIARCRLGWYSVVLVDRRSGRLWATLFYPASEGVLPCSPD